MTPAAKPPQASLAADLAVPLALIGIVLMMVLPLPGFLIDALLAISLAASIGVFLIGLFMESALEFSSFPSVILVATLLRLSLNVATTRMILLKGHEGHGAAGRVVEAFGRIVVGGNVVVGLVVFLILVVINFVVITKGAGRVAEVGARFALDGMPGKQMAIDQDLNAGVISADIARERRRALEREADFFGAMDGSSKFVKGDAIAGLLITAINLVGGLLIGLANGMTLAAAAETFSILSVGDALVSQVPALLISTAAGIVVTRTATGDQLGRALRTQLFGSRRAVAATAGVVGLFALLPGMPMLPFLALGGVLAWLSRQQPKAEALPVDESLPSDKPAVKPGSAEDIDAALPLDILALEVGYELVTAVDPHMGGNLVDRISALRKQMALDLGVVIPPVHIRDNLQLAPGAYRFMLLGTEVAKGSTRAGRLLAMDPSASAPPIDGEATEGSGLRHARSLDYGARSRVRRSPWLHRGRSHHRDRDAPVRDGAHQRAQHFGSRGAAAPVRGVQPHYSEARRRLGPEFALSRRSAARLPKHAQRKRLDSRSTLDSRGLDGAGSVDARQRAADGDDSSTLVASNYRNAYTGHDGTLSALVLDAPVEDMFRRSLRDIAAGTGGALDPEQAQKLGLSLEAAVKRMMQAGRAPCVITSPDVRRYLRAFAERRCPELAVLSFRELEPDATVRPFETIGFGKAAA
ncbi:MAG: flagellar biosynthesis protein FlhA [Polyangiaceae bacterium]